MPQSLLRAHLRATDLLSSERGQECKASMGGGDANVHIGRLPIALTFALYSPACGPWADSTML